MAMYVNRNHICFLLLFVCLFVLFVGFLLGGGGYSVFYLMQLNDEYRM